MIQSFPKTDVFFLLHFLGDSLLSHVCSFLDISYDRFEATFDYYRVWIEPRVSGRLYRSDEYIGYIQAGYFGL